MTQTIGKSEAKKFADAHEEGNFILNGYNVGNNPASKAMDLFNNNVGRNLRPIPGSAYLNPLLSYIAKVNRWHIWPFFILYEVQLKL